MFLMPKPTPEERKRADEFLKVVHACDKPDCLNSIFDGKSHSVAEAFAKELCDDCAQGMTNVDS
jgi:hypothetical protein